MQVKRHELNLLLDGVKKTCVADCIAYNAEASKCQRCKTGKLIRKFELRMGEADKNGF